MKREKAAFIVTMLLFGSIGLFVKYLPVPSSQLALFRGLLGSGCIFLFGLLKRGSLCWKRIRPNLLILILSGSAVGINWILLFEAYRFTTIPIATICYYAAPVIVMFLSPLILKERLEKRKVLCILTAMTGMVLVTGVSGGDGSLRGIFCGLGAAVFYASVMLLNKFLKGITGLESSFVQLLTAGIVLIPYVLLTEGVEFPVLKGMETGILLLVGILHTGICYTIYFTVLQKLPGQTAAVYSYLDPVAAILLSAVFLGESMTPVQTAGGILVLGAALVNELQDGKQRQAGNALG